MSLLRTDVRSCQYNGCRTNTKCSFLDEIYTQIDTVHSLSLLPFSSTISEYVQRIFVTLHQFILAIQANPFLGIAEMRERS
jgi:hypothetical protein